jgi:hypothetical protein
LRLYRNFFAAVPKGKAKEFAATPNAIHSMKDRPTAKEKS